MDAILNNEKSRNVRLQPPLRLITTALRNKNEFLMNPRPPGDVPLSSEGCALRRLVPGAF